MYHVRLFANEFESPNEIKELQCKGYRPVAVDSEKYFFSGKKTLFSLSENATVYGCFVTNDLGELEFHQKFAQPIEVSGHGSIYVEFS